MMNEMGLNVYMLTEDNIRTTTVVAQDIGVPLSYAIADVLSQGKIGCVR